MAIITYTKNYRETLAEMLDRFRIDYAEYKNSKVTYAGRLDPLAEGIMLILTDDDVHRKEEFLTFDKVYRVEFFLGSSTDTYDLLGMADSFDPVVVARGSLVKAISTISTITKQQYPAYSSKTLKGIALWKRARDNNLNPKDIPEKEIHIKKAEYLSSREVTSNDFYQEYIETLGLVQGNFRQEQIIDLWKTLLKNFAGTMTLYRAEFHVSSGTYIRSLIHELGTLLGTGAVCVRITRVQIGDKRLENY